MRGVRMAWADGLGPVGGEAAAVLGEAEATWALGRPQEAIERVLGWLEGMGRGAESAALAWLFLGECRLALDRLGEARAAFEQGLAAGGAEARSALGVRLRLGLVESEAWAGDMAWLRRWLGPVFHELDGYGDEELRARGRALAVALRYVEVPGGDAEEVLSAFAELGRVGAHGSRWRLCVGLARLLEVAGRDQGAAAWLRLARAGEIAAGWPSGVGPAALAEARVNAGMGRLVEADEALEIALGAARAQGDLEALEGCLDFGVDLSVAMGAPNTTLARLHEAAELAREADDGRRRARLLAQALRVALVVGSADAGATADALADVLAMLGPAALQADDAFEVARGLVDAGRGQAAADVMVRASQLAFGLGQPQAAAACLAEAARIAGQTGDGELAGAMWAEVVELATTYGLEDKDTWESEWRYWFPDG
jgi:tetratricopeptide (TPR) repeat protein